MVWFRMLAVVGAIGMAMEAVRGTHLTAVRRGAQVVGACTVVLLALMVRP